jgi:hypothetical protein
MYTLLMYTSLLWEATGPATLFSEACPETNLFIVNCAAARRTLVPVFSPDLLTLRVSLRLQL